MILSAVCGTEWIFLSVIFDAIFILPAVSDTESIFPHYNNFCGLIQYQFELYTIPVWCVSVILNAWWFYLLYSITVWFLRAVCDTYLILRAKCNTFFIFYCWGNSLKDFETLYGKCRSRKMAYVLMSKLLNDGLCSKTARVMREDCRSHNHRSPLNNCVIRRWKRMHKSAFLITHFWTIIV